MPPWMIGCSMPNISVIAVFTSGLQQVCDGRALLARWPRSMDDFEQARGADAADCADDVEKLYHTPATTSRRTGGFPVRMSRRCAAAGKAASRIPRPTTAASADPDCRGHRA